MYTPWSGASPAINIPSHPRSRAAGGFRSRDLRQRDRDAVLRERAENSETRPRTPSKPNQSSPPLPTSAKGNAELRRILAAAPRLRWHAGHPHHHPPDRTRSPLPRPSDRQIAMNPERLVAGLDIGSAKTTAIIAEVVGDELGMWVTA